MKFFLSMLADGLEKPWQTPDDFKGSSEELTLRVQAFPPTDPISQPRPTHAGLEKATRAR